MEFPPLADDMIEIIRAYASDFTVSAGTTIFARGERGTDMFVVLEGKVNIYTGDEQKAFKHTRRPRQVAARCASMVGSQVRLKAPQSSH